MHRLVHLTAPDGSRWWEVFSGAYVPAATFQEATDRYRDALRNGAEEVERVRVTRDVLKRTYGDSLSPIKEPPVYLRDFTESTDYSKNAFELSPGHLVFADTRGEAIRLFAESGKSADNFGRSVSASLLMGYEVVQVYAHDSDIPAEPKPAEPKSKPPALGYADPKLWLDEDDDYWWEVAPGKLLMRSMPDSAKRKFQEQPESAEEVRLVRQRIDIHPATSKEKLTKLTIEGKFRDPDGDDWFLMRLQGDDNDYMVMADTPTLAFQRFDIDHTTAEDLTSDMGRLQEWSNTDDLSDSFDTWEDRPETVKGGRVRYQGVADQLKPTVPAKSVVEEPVRAEEEPADDDDFDGKAVITIEEEPQVEQGTPTRPSFAPKRTDSYDRTWAELIPDHWMLIDEFENSPEKAWNYLRNSHFESGRELSDLEQHYGPMKDAGYVMLEPETFSIAELAEQVVAGPRKGHCRCDPPFDYENMAPEEDRRIEVDDYYYCVTCGKLRP